MYQNTHTSSHTKSIIQNTVQINDDLIELTNEFVKNYNNSVIKLNTIITNASDSDDVAIQKIVPFIGVPLKILNTKEISQLLSGDYNLIHIPDPTVINNNKSGLLVDDMVKELNISDTERQKIIYNIDIKSPTDDYEILSKDDYEFIDDVDTL
jgi:hypothetical protein